MAGYLESMPRIHVIELAPLGFRYYRGVFESFDEVPPRYTWKRVDYGMEVTMIYVDMHSSEPGEAMALLQ